MLGRGADAGGLAAFEDRLAAGATLSEVRSGLAHSAEAARVLEAAYRGVLGRAADAGALAYYEGRLADGASLAEVRAGLAQSDEAGAALRPVLRAALEREAGEAELARARAALAGGETLQGVLSGLLHSDAAGASARRIDAVYEAALGRDADLGGLVYHEGRLGAGASVEELRASLARSGEATAAVDGLYRSVLGRAADAGGAASVQDALAAGRSLAEARAGLAHSAEAEGHARSLFAQQLGRAPGADELRGFEAGLARPEAQPGAAGATFTVSTPDGGVGKLADADARMLVAELGVYVTLSGGLTPTLTAQDGTVLTFRNATELAGFALGVSQAQGRADKAAWATAGLTVSWLDRVGQGYVQAARAPQQGALASASAGDAQNAARASPPRVARRAARRAARGRRSSPMRPAAG